jgi:hypothetical protein
VVATGVPRPRVLVIGACLVLWLASFWLFDRGHFGWWLIAAFPLVCVLAFARAAVSDYVNSRARRGVHK